MDYGGTATPGEDYEIESRFLEIPAGSETFAFYFVLLNDASGNANEPEETIQMRLTELSRADYLAQSGGTASGQAYYTARRSQTPEGRTVLDLTVRLAARGSPTLEAGSLQLALSPATASPNEDPASDGDPPATVSFTVSLQDEGGSATTHELADLQYELVAFNRSAAYGEDFSFASDDSPEAISGGAKVVATLKAGEGSNTHVVTILDDEEAELAESFYLELVTLPPSDPDLVFIVDENDNSAVVTIAASDEVSERPGTVELAIAPSDVSGLDENAADPADRRITATATLSRAPGAGEQVVVPLRVFPREGSAGASADDYEFAPAEGEITISGTDTSGTLTLTIVDDEETEATERFTLALGELPSGWVAKEGTPSAYNFAVAENDPPEGAVRLTEFTVARATEGSGVVVSLAIEREESAANALASYTFPLVIRSATAEAGEDFTLPDTAEIVLSLAAHDTSGTADTEASNTFTIAALDDDIVEGSEAEYFEVQLRPERGPDGAEPVYISESAGSRLKFAYIDDNDQATFTLADVTATEGEAAEFTLSSDKAAAHDITFAWSLGGDLDGRVSAWESANAPLGQGVLKAGEQSASFSIQTEGDEDINASASDSQKTVTVRLTGARPGLLANNEVEAELNLVDDDKALPQITPKAASIDEGDIDGSYALSFSVVLDKPLPSDATTVALTVTATAAGSSVTPTPATISFAAGEGRSSKSFRVVLPATLNNNLIDTVARNLVVTVKAPDNHAQVDDNPVSASVPIENEDAGIQVDTAASATAYDEGVEDADGLVVRLINGPLANPMTVVVNWRDAASPSVGRTGQAGSATLAAGASGPLVIPITIPGDETISATARTGRLSIMASSSDAALKDGGGRSDRPLGDQHRRGRDFVEDGDGDGGGGCEHHANGGHPPD